MSMSKRTITNYSDGYIRIKDAAGYLSIAVRTLRAWVKDGRLVAYKPTERILLFKRSDLDAVMQSFATKNGAP